MKQKTSTNSTCVGELGYCIESRLAQIIGQRALAQRKKTHPFASHSKTKIPSISSGFQRRRQQSPSRIYSINPRPYYEPFVDHPPNK